MLPPEVEDQIQAFEEHPERVKAHPDELQDLLDACRDTYSQLITTRQHDEAIALMERLRRIVPGDPNVRRLTALACGGKGELALRWVDQSRVQPRDDLLEAVASLFRRAIEIDPSVPDPYWDIAVLKARFEGDYDGATQFYLRARAMGYLHPTMPDSDHRSPRPGGDAHIRTGCPWRTGRGAVPPQGHPGLASGRGR